MSVKISVVIPTYNRVDKLQEVLPTLLNQTMHPDDYEILLCDAGSTDGTAIRDALYGVNYDGVTGSITFDQTTGDANKDMAYIKRPPTAHSSSSRPRAWKAEQNFKLPQSTPDGVASSPEGGAIGTPGKPRVFITKCRAPLSLSATADLMLLGERTAPGAL